MGNNSASGSLARTAIAWIIIAAVAILAFKVLIAIVAGVLHTLMALVLLAAVVFAVVWALRHL
jgi:hypothetical protein